jgi:phospho-N-acetylmuramoyl-pentapeptide-transferase
MPIYLKLGLIFVIALCAQIACIIFFRRKKAFQSIYELSPKTHQNKAGTPSLGGIGILIGLWSIVIFFQLSKEILWLLAVFTSFASIGFIDDMQSLLNKKNKGLSAKHKFFMQCMIALLCLQSYSIVFTQLSIFEFIFYIFMMVGFSNATNLTDGLDGLLAGSSIITLVGFLLIADPYSTNSSLLIFILTLIMCVLAFFMVNKHPAKIFMGDTGSLALGAVFVGIALLLNNIWLLLAFGALYILETSSVIIQVIYYKRTKKRFFLMSPLHHHFELLGLKERTVVTLFWILTASFVGLGLVLYQ